MTDPEQDRIRNGMLGVMTEQFGQFMEADFPEAVNTSSANMKALIAAVEKLTQAIETHTAVQNATLEEMLHLQRRNFRTR